MVGVALARGDLADQPGQGFGGKQDWLAPQLEASLTIRGGASVMDDVFGERDEPRETENEPNGAGEATPDRRAR